MKVLNTKDNIDVALRKFKKKVTDSGLLQTLKDREFYTKPSVAKKISRGKARSRWLKYLQSQELPKKMY